MGSGDGFVNMKISMSQRTIECSLKIQRASWYDRWETEVSMQTEWDCLWEAEGEKKAKDC